MAKKTFEAETILKSEVKPCSPEIEYSPLDRQISLKAVLIDDNGDYYGRASSGSFYSILQTYLSADIESLDELKALEDCFLFGLTEIARERAKLTLKGN